MSGQAYCSTSNPGLTVRISICLGSLVVSAALCIAQALAQAGTETKEEPVRFSALGVSLRCPEGFVKETKFDGFGQEATKSSVMVIRIPGPYDQVSAGFTKENMAPRGLTLLDKSESKVGDKAGILVHFQQSAAGIKFEKWSLVFGDETHTTLITATFPVEHAARLSAPLKAAVLSTRLEKSEPAEPFADLPFTLAQPEKLKLATAISRSVLYTLDGKLPAKSPEDPIFVAAPSLGKFTALDTKATAERKLKSTAETKNLKITSHEPVEIDELKGYESLADAEDAKSGTPIVVYQVMLFDDDSYIVLAGLVGKKKAEEFLPEFKKLAQSLKRK
jgi:hypothetical protein